MNPTVEFYNSLIVCFSEGDCDYGDFEDALGDHWWIIAKRYDSRMHWKVIIAEDAEYQDCGEVAGVLGLNGVSHYHADDYEGLRIFGIEAHFFQNVSAWIVTGVQL